MANYNTASDCRSSQDMPAKELAETNCQAAESPCQETNAPCQANRNQGTEAPCQANRNQGTGASCQANRNQGTGSPCQANMRQRQMAGNPRQMANNPRQMAGNPRQMAQGCRQGTSCQGNMGPRQMAPATHPHHMGSRPSRPSMMPPCAGQDDPLAGMALAMAYVPWQFFNDTYEPDKALQYGTIFPELNKPFYGKGGCLK